MTKAEQIAALIEQAAPRMAIVFNGAEPRLIGTMEPTADLDLIRRVTDSLLIGSGLGATHISRAEVGGRICIIARG